MSVSLSPSLRQRLTQARHWRFALFLLSMTALVLAALWLTDSRTKLAAAYDALAVAQRNLVQAQRNETIATREVERSDIARNVLRIGQESGYTAQQWGERYIHVRSASMQRDAINALLADIYRAPGRLFGADAFDLSVSRPEDGLFSSPTTATNMPPLVITLQGRLLFRVDAQ